MLFMITGTYTPKSLQIFINEPKDRQSIAAGFIESCGGRLQAMYHTATGKTHFIVEAPGEPGTTMAAIMTTLRAKERLENISFDRLQTPAEFKDGLQRAKDAEKAYQER